MTKKNLLGSLEIGTGVAEQERDELQKYFIETDFWTRFQAGSVDIVFGQKGAGKSAIYVLIQQTVNELSENKIDCIFAENPQGDPAFNQLEADPPTPEENLRDLWKLYFAALVGNSLAVEENKKSEDERELLIHLRELKLIAPPKHFSLASLVRGVRAALKRINAVEAEIQPQDNGMVFVTPRIKFGEPTFEELQQGYRSLTGLLKLADRAIGDRGRVYWILLDRLDSAFTQSRALEESALRALFRTYLDVQGLGNFKLKLFLRSDIWGRITRTGFPEASHIRKEARLAWDSNGLMNLIVMRLANNESFCGHFDTTKEKIRDDFELQKDIFYKAFPEKVDRGPNKSATFDWILARTRDGLGINTPREIILFLTAAIQKQIEMLERGEEEPAGSALFSAAALKEALGSVSESRLTTVMFAEHPDLREAIEALRDGHSEHTIQTLSRAWAKSPAETTRVANRLIEVGFFEKKPQTYKMPFIYRPALNITQGRAPQ